jgi:indolepyruvate ferredoxin oxidoreductase
MLMLGCDIVVAVSDDALSKTAAGSTHAIVNTGTAITGEFLRNPDREFPAGAMEQSVVDAVGREAATFIDASAPGHAPDGAFRSPPTSSCSATPSSAA